MCPQRPWVQVSGYQTFLDNFHHPKDKLVELKCGLFTSYPELLFFCCSLFSKMLNMSCSGSSSVT